MEYFEKMAESFMDKCATLEQKNDDLEVTLQLSLDMLENLLTHPYSGDYEDDENRDSCIWNFINEHRPKDRKISQVSPDLGDLPF